MALAMILLSLVIDFNRLLLTPGELMTIDQNPAAAHRSQKFFFVRTV
jgi:hypothetical protein